MGIWLILYGLDKAAEGEYLEWFHDIHIPEKLARSGYDWAAHYRVLDGDAGELAPQYLALFGGETTQPFYNPSPAQIKPTQDDLTRRMMGYRVQPHMQILTQEWNEVSSSVGHANRDAAAVHSDAIRLQFLADSVPDQTIAAWCAQELFQNELGASCHRVQKLVASTGSPRHVVLQEHSLEKRSWEKQSSGIQASAARDELIETWAQQHGDAGLSELRAVRCWPALSEP